VIRMEQARQHEEYKRIFEDLKPGSGKIWKNELTKPHPPKITGLTLTDNSDLQGIEPMIINQQDRPVIKSLQRPISARLSSHQTVKKRHN
jgi:hypothetical protein